VNVGGLVEFLEDALRPHLPARPPKAPQRHSRADDIAYAATHLLGARGFRGAGFASLWVDVLADGEVVRVAARHSCGSRLIVEFTGESLYAAGPGADRLILDTLDRAGCYCVPREVLVPCTAQGCEVKS
jgi:hypothetical protein